MSQSAEGSFPFLELSRELRDSVYEALLLSSRPPPSSPEHGGARKYPSKEDEDHFEYHNHYPADDLKSTSGPLLLTCRQINEEVEEVMVRLTKSNRPLYRLDLMLLDERELYITWLAFPHPTNEISTLYADFRLSGNVEGKESILRLGNGGPPILIWGLFTLIERFLQRGPDFLAPRNQGRHMRIGELRVNVLTPPSPPPSGYANRHYYDRSRKGHASPENMVGFLIRYMSYMLRRCRYTVSESRLVFERIKRITFSLDGVERQSWELTTLEPEYTG